MEEIHRSGEDPRVPGINNATVALELRAPAFSLLLLVCPQAAKTFATFRWNSIEDSPWCRQGPRGPRESHRDVGNDYGRGLPSRSKHPGAHHADTPHAVEADHRECLQARARRGQRWRGVALVLQENKANAQTTSLTFLSERSSR